MSDKELDEQRARLLGVLSTQGFGKLFPIIRKKFKDPSKPWEWTTQEVLAYWKGPIRKNIDYSSVGRKTFLVTDPDFGKESK